MGFFCIIFCIVRFIVESLLPLVEVCGFAGQTRLVFVSVFLLCGFPHWLSLYRSMFDVVPLVGQHVFSLCLSLQLHLMSLP